MQASAVVWCPPLLQGCRTPQRRTRHGRSSMILGVQSSTKLGGSYGGDCQNYGPLLGAVDTRCRTILRTQKGTIILTTTHVNLPAPLVATRKIQRLQVPWVALNSCTDQKYITITLDIQAPALGQPKAYNYYLLWALWIPPGICPSPPEAQIRAQRSDRCHGLMRAFPKAPLGSVEYTRASKGVPCHNCWVYACTYMPKELHGAVGFAWA